MSKRGLGRGLSALIPSAGAEDVEPQSLPLNMVAPNPKQPRTAIAESAITELADSIRKVGVLQPVLVRPHGDGYQIIAG